MSFSAALSRIREVKRDFTSSIARKYAFVRALKPEK
jgi:hypothetical protein